MDLADFGHKRPRCRSPVLVLRDRLPLGADAQQGYIGTDGNIWCVWADPNSNDAGGAGAVYFAPRDEVPKGVAPLCHSVRNKKDVDQYLEGQASEAVEELQGEAVPAWQQFLVGIALGVRPTALLQVTPELQEADEATCAGTYAVAVQRAPDRDLHVRMDYGDGASDSAVVAAGSGVATLSFTHQFDRADFASAYVQRATILETGHISYGITTHDISNQTHDFVGAEGQLFAHDALVHRDDRYHLGWAYNHEVAGWQNPSAACNYYTNKNDRHISPGVWSTPVSGSDSYRVQFVVKDSGWDARGIVPDVLSGSEQNEIIWICALDIDPGHNDYSQATPFLVRAHVGVNSGSGPNWLQTLDSVDEDVKEALHNPQDYIADLLTAPPCGDPDLC